MQKLLLYLLFYLLPGYVIAQSGLGQESLFPDVAYPQPTTSRTFFPASVLQVYKPTLYLSHTSLYGITGLSSSSLSFVWPRRRNSWGVSMAQWGLNEYRTFKTGISVGHQWGEVRMGLTANVRQLSVASQGVKYGMELDASLFMPLNAQTFIGAYMTNILQQGWLEKSRTVNQRPSALMIGIAQHPLDVLYWQLAVGKSLYRRPSLYAGLRYEWEKAFFLQLSYRSHPSQLQWQLGWQGSFWALAISMKHHYVLGRSYECLFTWQMSGGKQKDNF